MSSSYTIFPVTAFQEKIIFFALVFLLGMVSLIGATLGATPSILFLFALGISFLLALLFPRPVVWAMMTLTILFERFFTLQPLVFGKSVVKLYPIDMMILGLLGALFVQWLLFHHRKKTLPWSDIWLLLFFGYITLLFLFSVFGIAGSESSVAFSTWKQYVFYASIFFLVRLAVTSLDDLKIFAKVMLGSIMSAIIFLMIGMVRGEGLWSEYTPLSTAGVRILAFPHALFFSLALMVSFLLLSTDVIRGKWRTALFTLVPLLSIGIIGSLMRHLWLALGVAFIIGLLLLPIKHWSRFIRNGGAYLGMLSVFALLFLSILSLMPHSSLTERIWYSIDIVSTRITSIGDTYDESAAWRGAVWQSAFARFAEHPLIGIGLGNSVPVELGEYRDIIEVRNIHNSWFALIVQTGLIGSMLFCLFLVSLFKSVFRLRGGDELATLSRVILITLSAFFVVVFFFQPYLETNLLSLFFWALLGLMAILSRKDFFGRI